MRLPFDFDPDSFKTLSCEQNVLVLHMTAKGDTDTIDQQPIPRQVKSLLATRLAELAG